MRSTQFDEYLPFERESEEHRVRDQRDKLCDTLKRLGYAQNNQVRLYGEIFQLVSDPIRIGENLVFVDALHGTSGKVMRVRIPSSLVQVARIKGRAA